MEKQPRLTLREQREKLLEMATSYIISEGGRCVPRLTMDNDHDPFIMIYLPAYNEITAFRVNPKNGEAESTLGELVTFFDADGTTVHYVKAERQHNGIGRELMLFIEDLSKTLELDEIKLDCAGGRKGNNFSFYLHLGYEVNPRGIEEDYWVSMIKRLDIYGHVKTKAEKRHEEIFESAPQEIKDFISEGTKVLNEQIKSLRR